MNLIYSKKENPYIYIVLAILVFLVFIAGIYYANYYLWYILAPVVFLIIKGLNVLKKDETPVIKLDNEGLTVLKVDEENILYKYHEITEIYMDSRYLNGFIKIKSNSKKIHLDSVAIPILKQKEITDLVNDRILK
ncbi:hypothetical protein FPF71_16095 [Algibacter amylolyticus]|uniref:Uncharacterized protein n=1 Tax=Algibacter amylolyticus TaxID=1608400 RepID=A0A5M7AVQ3_9FLAO|nr:hypothetical protein [Algibacter amylolyticus]KAA5821399.1 hypothetical protein F2B50_16095 [Algibacter amylolyticus]MBB5268268.1 hypothetical protein [Algibacter amylolyticus]TSJ72911.1 hypothetical protein FPF71_16095 [Algibacter amylolyticus]